VRAAEDGGDRDTGTDDGWDGVWPALQYDRDPPGQHIAHRAGAAAGDRARDDGMGRAES
jgi:hypothetical protein